jgi:hypothetical protein
VLSAPTSCEGRPPASRDAPEQRAGETGAAALPIGPGPVANWHRRQSLTARAEPDAATAVS